MTLIDLPDLADDRLSAYRNLRERTLRGETIFVAEGPLVVDRLMRSNCPVESILISNDYRDEEGLLAQVPEDVPIYSVPTKELLDTVVGFEFYQGILALGRRPTRRSFVEGVRESVQKGTCRSGAWIVLPDATKPDNLGLVFRAAAGLGAEAVVLGRSCCDPYSRRALRVSMGGVLQTPIFHADDLAAEIELLRNETGMAFYATVLDNEAVALTDMNVWPTRTAFLFGNEYRGLPDNLIRVCNAKLMIPMRPDVDSLNLGVSAGIFLYEYNRGLRLFEKEINKE